MAARMGRGGVLPTPARTLLDALAPLRSFNAYGLFADTLDRNQTFDLAANRAGIRSKIYKNALPGLFYRGDAKPPGYGGGDTFGRVVTDPDYNNLGPGSG